MEQVKNEKTFFEVFPTLRADGELKMLFQDVEVKKITTNSTKSTALIFPVRVKWVTWFASSSVIIEKIGRAHV